MKVRLLWEAERVVAIELPRRPPSDLTRAELRELETDLAALPLQFPPASDFRRGVWEAIRRIPFGQTATYQQLAEQIRNRLAAFLLQDGVFTPISEDLTVYIRGRDRDGTLRGILVEDARQRILSRYSVTKEQNL